VSSSEGLSKTGGNQDASKSMTEVNENVFQKNEREFREYFMWTDTMGDLPQFSMADADLWTTCPFYDRPGRWFEDYVLRAEPDYGNHSHFMYDFNFLEDRIIQDDKVITSSNFNFDKSEPLDPLNIRNCVDLDDERNFSKIVPVEEKTHAIAPQMQETGFTDLKYPRTIRETNFNSLQDGKSLLDGNKTMVFSSFTT